MVAKACSNPEVVTDAAAQNCKACNNTELPHFAVLRWRLHLFNTSRHATNDAVKLPALCGMLYNGQKVFVLYKHGIRIGLQEPRHALDTVCYACARTATEGFRLSARRRHAIEDCGRLD